MLLRIISCKTFFTHSFSRSFLTQGGSLLLALVLSFTLGSTATASFCKNALKAMGQPDATIEQPLYPDRINLKVLFGTIIDTHDIILELKKEQNRATQLVRDTSEMQTNITNLINRMAEKETLLRRQKFFMHNEAQEFARYFTKLKDLKLSSDHLKKSVPMIIEQTVAKIVSYHHGISEAVVKQMEDQLADLIRNDPDSTKIMQLNNMIVTQALNSKNDEIFSRLKDIIDGLKVVEDSVQNQLPILMPFIDQNRETVAEWLMAYNDPIFREMFQSHYADIVFEAYEMTKNGSLIYSFDSIETFVITQERIRK